MDDIDRQIDAGIASAFGSRRAGRLTGLGRDHLSEAVVLKQSDTHDWRRAQVDRALCARAMTGNVNQYPEPPLPWIVSMGDTKVVYQQGSGTYACSYRVAGDGSVVLGDPGPAEGAWIDANDNEDDEDDAAIGESIGSMYELSQVGKRVAARGRPTYGFQPPTTLQESAMGHLRLSRALNKLQEVGGDGAARLAAGIQLLVEPNAGHVVSRSESRPPEIPRPAPAGQPAQQAPPVTDAEADAALGEAFGAFLGPRLGALAAKGSV